MSNSAASVKATLQSKEPPDMVMVVDKVTAGDLYQTYFRLLPEKKNKAIQLCFVLRNYVDSEPGSRVFYRSP